MKLSIPNPNLSDILNGLLLSGLLLQGNIPPYYAIKISEKERIYLEDSRERQILSGCGVPVYRARSTWAGDPSRDPFYFVTRESIVYQLHKLEKGLTSNCSTTALNALNNSK